MGKAKRERSEAFAENNAETLQQQKIEQLLLAPLTCQWCGDCCRNKVIELTFEDIKREPKLKAIARPISELPEEYTLAGCEYVIDVRRWDPDAQHKECPFLVDNKCEIHETKPEACCKMQPCIYSCKVAKLNMSPLALSKICKSSWEFFSHILSANVQRVNEVNTPEEQMLETEDIMDRLRKNNINLN